MARQVVRASIKGVEELRRALKELTDTFGGAAGERAAIGALLEVARPIVRTAKRLAPVSSDGPRPGLLRRSIRAKQASVWVGGSRTRRRMKVPFTVNIRPTARYAHLVEFGTAPRRQKSGRYTGHAPPQPFMRPAWAQHRAALTADLAPRIWEHIRKVARKHRARRVARLAARLSL